MHWCIRTEVSSKGKRYHSKKTQKGIEIAGIVAGKTSSSSYSCLGSSCSLGSLAGAKQLLCLKGKNCLCTLSSYFSTPCLILTTSLIQTVDLSPLRINWRAGQCEIGLLLCLSCTSSRGFNLANPHHPTALVSDGVMNKQLHHLCSCRDDEHIWFCSRRAQGKQCKHVLSPNRNDSCFARVVPSFPIQELLPFLLEKKQALETRNSLKCILPICLTIWKSYFIDT